MTPISLVAPSGRYLSFAEREEIAAGAARGFSVRLIARLLGRAASTVSRELRRNTPPGAGRAAYRASDGQRRCEERAVRPKVAKLAADGRLRAYVEERLAGLVAHPDGSRVVGPAAQRRRRQRRGGHDRRWGSAWSPEQIAKRLVVEFPDDRSMRIAKETIYQSLYVQARGALRKELTAALRSGRAVRVPNARSASAQAIGRSFVSEELLISERPAEAADRAVAGHWEGDLIIGAKSSAIGVLVERRTRLVVLLHLPPIRGAAAKNAAAPSGHGAVQVRDAIIAVMGGYPASVCRSLTWDQGSEIADHAAISAATNLAVYFCEPQSPWQRATGENTNGLLRQYFPRGTDHSRYTNHDLQAVAHTLNNRPRKTLDWKTPNEAFAEALRSLEHDSVATTP